MCAMGLVWRFLDWSGVLMNEWMMGWMDEKLTPNPPQITNRIKLRQPAHQLRELERIRPQRFMLVQECRRDAIVPVPVRRREGD